MTDLVLQSGQTSTILRSLASEVTVDNSYEIAPSYPILSKNVRYLTPVQAIQGAPASQEVSWNLNKSMILTGMQIETAVTVAATTSEDLGSPYGLSLYEKIEIKANNKVIQTLSDSYILARTVHSTSEKASAVYRRACPLNPTTYEPIVVGTDVAYTVFTPIFSQFFEDVKNGLDLGFWEQVQVVARFNSKIRSGVVNTLTGVTACKLWVWSYVPESKAYDLLRARNCQPQKPLNMLAYNSFRESVTLTSSTTTTIRLNGLQPVYNLYFYIRYAAGTTPASHNTALTWLSHINDFDFSVGGTKLFESVPGIVSNYEGELANSAGGVMVQGVTGSSPLEVRVGRFSNGPICLNFGMEAWNRLSNSGALSFNSVNNPQITVRYSTNADFASYELIVCTEYWNILTLDASNGQIAQTLSN